VQERNASFTFTGLCSGGAQIDWRYAFISRNLIAAIILKLLVATFWQGFTQSGLTNVRLLAERRAVKSDM
jgi:hypothetical protein